MFPFERMNGRGDPALGDDEVACFGVLDFDVGARGIEVRVVEDDLARFQDCVKEYPLGRAALVRGDDVAKSGELRHHRVEALEGAAPRVRLVTAHHRAPLVGGHRSRSGIGQQVDENVLGAQPEDIVPGMVESKTPLRGGCEFDRLDGFDPEWLDDRLHPEPCSRHSRTSHGDRASRGW
jgi:hypothetical protein